MTTAEITEPGVYDIPASVYHTDPVPGGSLTSSGARKLLPPNCPALFHHQREHGQPHREEFDFGHAAHREVLGVGEPIRELAFPNYQTRAAQKARAAAYEAGEVPLLATEAEKVRAMADAIRRHPQAGPLLSQGTPEQTLVWRDEAAGVMCRAMVDVLPDHIESRRTILRDYKTTMKADHDSIAKSIATYGYHQQGAWYLDGAQALGRAGRDAAFVLVFQEKIAPYLITVVQLTDADLELGRRRNRRALEIYRECTAADLWPSYSEAVEFVSLPAWAEARQQLELS